jgi:xylose dehydrogenase (NAD/NADP)
MNPMIYPPLRVGIMGAAKIARKNIAAIQNQVSNCKIVAIASRSLSKANALHENNVLKEWSQNVEIIAGEDAYERLIEADGVDAVYIPLPVW